jgi:hypothetical protein
LWKQWQTCIAIIADFLSQISISTSPSRIAIAAMISAKTMLVAVSIHLQPTAAAGRVLVEQASRGVP